MTDTEVLALRIQSQAYFDELERIEKQAMLAAVPTMEKQALSLGGLLRGGKGLISNIGIGAQRLRSVKGGGEGVIKGLTDLADVGRKGAQTGGTLGGVGAVLKTRRGKALAAGLGAGALGLGGAGFLAGRLSKGGDRGQNVYVR